MKNARSLGTTALAALLAAQPVMAQMTELGAGEGRVDIVAWPGYIERGETMAEFDWVTSFEEATGCMVQRQDRQHLGRDGGADERRRLRPRDRLGRCLAAADRRQARAADQP
jgi:hypothetical protein